MKPIKIIYSSILYVLICISCKDEKSNYLVADKSLLSYQKGDTLIYQNEMLENDSFIVNNIEYYYLPTGSADESYKEGYNFYFNKLNNSSDSNNYIIFIGYNYHININWENTFYYSTSSDKIVYDKIEILGTSYENVRRLDPNDFITADTILYHYNFGILQYFDNDRHIWKLNNRSTH
jgi:hypothetical protein